MDPAECVICERGRPLEVFGELPAVWVTVPALTPLPGYVCIVSKRHVRDPFELPEPERRAFWADVDAVAAAIDRGLRPLKLNYEIHGNTLPHLHLHLYCRWPGDRFSGGPIDYRATEPRTAEDLAAIRSALGPMLDSAVVGTSRPPRR